MFLHENHLLASKSCKFLQKVSKYENRIRAFGILFFPPGMLSGGSDQGRTPKMLFPYLKIDHFISARNVIFLFHPKFKQNPRKSARDR